MKKLVLCSAMITSFIAVCASEKSYAEPVTVATTTGAVVGTAAAIGGAVVGTAVAALPVVAPIAVTDTVVAVGAHVSNWNSDCSSGSLTYESVGGKSIQSPDDNEYLYLTQSDYNTAKAEFKKHSNSGNGKGYECDGAGARQCTGDDVVSMKAGHVFKGKVINKPHKYKCHVPLIGVGDDYWEDLGEIVEPKPGEKACKIEGLTVKIGDHIHVDCKNSNYSNIKTGEQCRAYCLKQNNELYSVYGIEICPKGYEPASKANLSGFSPKISDQLYYECKKQQKPGPIPPKSCKESRSTAEGKACCDLPSSVAKWTGSQCVCQAADTEFKMENGVGVCAPKGGCGIYKDNPEAFACCEAKYTWLNGKCECPEGTKWSYDSAKKTGSCVADNSNVLSNCVYRFNGKVKCANGNSMTINEQRPLTVAELGGMSCDQFNNLYQSNVGKLNEFFASYCGGGAIISIVTGPSGAEVKNAQSVLSAFFSTAQSNASVWKNSEGKFNTARLASDLTAGVVLGSVGGVVSGVVIKKNQVKKGFEALHCAVGGQKVADWGDEFNVGLR